MSGLAKIGAAIIGAITSIGLSLSIIKREKRKNLQDGIGYLKNSYLEKLNNNYEVPCNYSLLPYPSLLKHLINISKQQVTIETKLNSVYANRAEAQKALRYINDIIKDFNPNQ